METEAQKIIQSQLAMLPEDIKFAILSSKMDENLAKIAKEHGLHVDQAAKLEEATSFLLLGLMNTQEFLSALTAGTGISPTEATEIAKSIDLYILSPIRSSMREIQRKLDEADRSSQSKEMGANENNIVQPLQTVAGNTITTPIEPPPSPAFPSQSSTTSANSTASGPIPNLRTMPKDIARVKMEESIRMPKEEIGMRYKGDGDAKGEKYSTDPYREQPQ